MAPDTFAFGPVSQLPSGLQPPATSCLMLEGFGRAWPQILQVSTLSSRRCLPKSLSCHGDVKKGGWSWCRILHLRKRISSRVSCQGALGERPSAQRTPVPRERWKIKDLSELGAARSSPMGSGAGEPRWGAADRCVCRSFIPLFIKSC